MRLSRSVIHDQRAARNLVYEFRVIVLLKGLEDYTKKNPQVLKSKTLHNQAVWYICEKKFFCDIYKVL